MTLPIRAVLFDKDGVLFDFQKTWGGWAATLLNELAEGDTALMQEMAERIRYDIPTRLFAPDSPVIAGTAEVGVNLLLPSLPDWTFEELLDFSNERAATAPQVETTPLLELMQRLRRMGLRLGVSTNDSERAARANLASVGAQNAFDMIMGFDSGYGAKPQSGMQLAFADAMDLPTDQIVMVGDSTHDMEAAQAAGMRRVAVLTGPATRADLQDHAEVVLGSIAELPDWLAAQ